jgi:hypothetical protein
MQLASLSVTLSIDESTRAMPTSYLIPVKSVERRGELGIMVQPHYSCIGQVWYKV